MSIPGSSSTTPRGGAPLLADVTRWKFWWEFNKDRFIGLKEAVHGNGTFSGSDDFYMGLGQTLNAVTTLAPTVEQIKRQILPALKQTLDGTKNRDIVGAVMVAMAKIGRDHPDFDILEIMAARLNSGDQEIRETAALSMGISQMIGGVDRYLIDLVADSPTGRKLVGRGEVDYRTRSFAAYGLGLVAWATSDADLKLRCFSVLKSVLEDDSIISRDVRVAAINGLSLLASDGGSGGKEGELFRNCLTALETYYLKPLGAGEQLIQAHVLPAIAKLVTRDGPAAAVRRYQELFRGELEGRGRKSNDFQRSAALALGVLCAPADTACSKALLEYYRNGRDHQARFFSLIALAQIGGDDNRNALLTAFARGNKGVEKPWGALALGVYAHAASERGREDVDPLVGRTLQRALVDNRNPDLLAALSIGLGLSKYTEAADDLRDLLIKHRSQDELAGYLCIGLALMGDGRSREDITDIVQGSVRRPELLRQAAVALGKLGDKRAGILLGDMLRDGSQNLARLSAIASALGFIGDSMSVTPLLGILSDESLTDLTRAFAAVALGGVADKESLPWNAKIGANLNYRASVETLFDGASGILDIL
jgi:HEAT repeat protein